MIYTMSSIHAGRYFVTIQYSCFKHISNANKDEQKITIQYIIYFMITKSSNIFLSQQ